MNHLTIAPVLLPLLTGLFLLLAPGHKLWLVRSISLSSATLLLLVSGLLLMQADSGDIGVYALGNWAPPFGIVLVLDRLSALMVATSAVLALGSLSYAARHPDSGRTLHSLIHFLLMGVNGAFLTGDLFNLFVFFEVLLLASYALLTYGGGAERTRASVHYVVLNLTGSGLFLIAVASLYGLTGTLNMAHMAERVAALSPEDAPLVAAAAGVLMVVFGLKAAVLPLYFWLPRAYASAVAPVAAMFAIMTKVGIYALLRVNALIFGDSAGTLAHFATGWLWPLALLTLVMGFIGLLAARALRMQIAYLVIVSVGTLLAGVALRHSAAYSATLYYLLHSTWVCGGLFLLADLIQRQRGSVADGLFEGPRMAQSQLLGLLFCLAAASIAGLPPLSGFVGKVLLLQAVGTGWTAWWLWSLLLLSGLAGIVALSRAGSTLFWRVQPGQTGQTRSDPIALLVTTALLLLGPALVVWGDRVTAYTDATAQQLTTPATYINAVSGVRPVPGRGQH